MTIKLDHGKTIRSYILYTLVITVIKHTSYQPHKLSQNILGMVKLKFPKLWWVCVVYWPLTEPSVGDYSSRMHLCKQVEAEGRVKREMHRRCEIIYTRVSTADMVSLSLSVGQSRGSESARSRWSGTWVWIWYNAAKKLWVDITRSKSSVSSVSPSLSHTVNFRSFQGIKMLYIYIYTRVIK